MLKRLPILCVTLLALAACSHGNDASTAPSSTPAPASTASATPAPADTAPAVATSSATASSAPTPAAPITPAPNAAPFVDTGKWVEGKNYFLIDPAQPTSHPGKIELTEVFSYACPACNSFHTTMDELVKTMPSNVVVLYLPAAFRPDENWPLYQRAFYAAQALGVADKTYDAMFDATWKTGETATYNLQEGKPKPREAWPTIDDLAKFYAKYGVDPKEFVGVANSFSINTQMKRADDLMKSYGIDSTPSLVVDGKYRFTPVSAGGIPQTIELAQWLVAKEAAGK